MKSKRILLTDIPSIHEIEKSVEQIPSSSPYKKMAEYSFNQVSLFEKKTIRN